MLNDFSILVYATNIMDAILSQGLNILKFTEKFSTNGKCRECLSVQQSKKGYKCSNCGHDHYVALLRKISLTLNNKNLIRASDIR